jgi:hypothetical protein
MTDITALNDSSFKALGFCDAELTQVSWIKSGRDMQLQLTLANGTAINLICAWARELQVSLTQQANHGGYPLLWEATLSPAADNCWQLALDFAGQGQITLTCNSVGLGA